VALLVATPIDELGIVRVIVDWSPYEHELVNLYRVLPDGSYQEVIGSPVRLSGGKAIIYDTTAPFDVDLLYRAEMRGYDIIKDDFQRTVGDGWGTPTYSITPGTYTVSGGDAPDWWVDAGMARMRMDTTVTRRAVGPGVYKDVQVEATIQLDQVPTGNFIQVGVSPRYVDDANTYNMGASLQPDGTITAFIIATVGGITNTLAAKVLTGLTYGGANTPLRIVGQSIGDTHWMRVLTSSDPDRLGRAWDLQATEGSIATGSPSVYAMRGPGNTNVSPIAVVSDFYTFSFNWNTLEAARTVRLLGDPHGWIRDPMIPGRSIRLDNCAEHDFSCLNNERFAFFQSLSGEQYTSRSGVFPVIDAARPNTVAQLREDFSTELRFATTTLDDIRAVRTLFSSGRNLLLSLPVKYGWGLDNHGTDIFAAGDITATRLNTRDMGKPYRQWSVPLAVAELDDAGSEGWVAGNNIPLPGATYRDMASTHLTYGELSTVATSPEVQDLFNGRTVSNGFGVAAPTGGPWTVALPPSSNYSVSGDEAHITVTQPDTPSLIIINNVQATNAGSTSMRIPTPTGAGILAGMACRYIDNDNYALAVLRIEPDNTGIVQLFSRINGAFKILAHVPTGITQAPGDRWSLEYMINGSTLVARAWITGTDRPENWTASTNKVLNPAVSGPVGLFVNALPGNTGTPLTVDIDFINIDYSARTYLDWSQGVFT